MHKGVGVHFQRAQDTRCGSVDFVLGQREVTWKTEVSEDDSNTGGRGWKLIEGGG